MRTVSATVALALALLVLTGAVIHERGSPCDRGEARAFVAVTGDRLSGVGGISNQFDSAGRLFARRYNCTTGGAQVRRVDLGLYEVLFPGIRATTAIASASNSEGTVASVQTVDRGYFRIRLLGPQLQGNELLGRDVPFVIVVY